MVFIADTISSPDNSAVLQDVYDVNFQTKCSVRSHKILTQSSHSHNSTSVDGHDRAASRPQKQ